MSQLRPGREVMVVGVGLHPFGRFRDKDLATLAREAVLSALKDSGVSWKDIPVAYFGHVYYHGMSVGETALGPLGLTGIPIINVENACCSGSSAFWQAYWGIASGIFDLALAFGAEKVPSGPVTVTAADSPDRYIGGDHMMAGYALRARRYMAETGAPAQALAQVAVKARQLASMNPFAHRKDTYTVEQVLASRLVADPLTLFQCCPTSEGAAAAVLCAREALDQYGVDAGRAIRVAAATLTSGSFNGKGSDHSAFSPYRTERAGQQAYEMSGLGPEDVDLVQVHDAATIAEFQHLEALGLVPQGEGWRATLEGRTALGGAIPTNTDGGLLAMGHPFGATGIRMVHETVTQLRGEAGPRQVADARVGMAQCSGAGDVTTVQIFTR
ncbi:MAG TPA: thiolase family protein [Dehalococcoidia bacterium]|nr:thiolase family protein [Dehalococcoidia bacterium]